MIAMTIATIAAMTMIAMTIATIAAMTMIAMIAAMTMIARTQKEIKYPRHRSLRAMR